MTNQFFKLALAQATRLAGKPGRLLQLVAQLLHRLYKTDRRQLSMKGLTERLQTFGRLVNSYARGHYREIPVKTLVKIIAALIYFLNPIDLIPDAIVGIGFIDDLAVLTWVYKSAQDELDSFIEWEKNRVIF